MRVEFRVLQGAIFPYNHVKPTSTRGLAAANGLYAILIFTPIFIQHSMNQLYVRVLAVL
jgi:hypothetical protein